MMTFLTILLYVQIDFNESDVNILQKIKNSDFMHLNTCWTINMFLCFIQSSGTKQRWHRQKKYINTIYNINIIQGIYFGLHSQYLLANFSISLSIF